MQTLFHKNIIFFGRATSNCADTVKFHKKVDEKFMGNACHLRVIVSKTRTIFESQYKKKFPKSFSPLHTKLCNLTNFGRFRNFFNKKNFYPKERFGFSFKFD